MEVPVSYINGGIGVDLPADQVRDDVMLPDVPVR